MGVLYTTCLADGAAGWHQPLRQLYCSGRGGDDASPMQPHNYLYRSLHADAPTVCVRRAPTHRYTHPTRIFAGVAALYYTTRCAPGRDGHGDALLRWTAYPFLTARARPSIPSQQLRSVPTLYRGAGISCWGRWVALQRAPPTHFMTSKHLLRTTAAGVATADACGLAWHRSFLPRAAACTTHPRCAAPPPPPLPHTACLPFARTSAKLPSAHTHYLPLYPSSLPHTLPHLTARWRAGGARSGATRRRFLPWASFDTHSPSLLLRPPLSCAPTVSLALFAHPPPPPPTPPKWVATWTVVNAHMPGCAVRPLGIARVLPLKWAACYVGRRAGRTGRRVMADSAYVGNDRPPRHAFPTPPPLPTWRG